MSRPDLAALAEAERLELADLLGELEPQEWDAPTLCDRWSVREVVAHVFSYDDLRPHQLGGLFVRGRLDIARVNELAMQPWSRDSPAQLISRARTHLRPRGLPAAMKGGIALTDAVIHQQDIRRPLGRPRSIPAERIVPALNIAVTSPVLGTRRMIRDLQLSADDVDWRHGRGWVLRGPAEAVLMAVAGRADALPDCTGPGVPRLRTRLAGSRS